MSARGSPKKALTVARAAALVLASSTIGCGTGYTFPGLGDRDDGGNPNERLTAEQSCRSLAGGRTVYEADGGFSDCCFDPPDGGAGQCCKETGRIFFPGEHGTGGCSSAVPGPFVPPEMA